MRQKLIMGVVVANYLPKAAGHSASTLHWLMGFRELGWDVWMVESLKSGNCRDDAGNPCVPDASRNVRNWREFVAAFGFQGRESLVIDGKPSDPDALLRFADGADLFLNYAGQFSDHGAIRGVGTTAYLDVDPGFTQTWAVGYGCNMHLDEHQQHVTIGAAYGKPDCRIPETGHQWIPTLPPIATSLYGELGADSGPAADAPWTTVTHWFGTKEVDIEGMTLYGKRESFLPLVSLPHHLSHPILVATDLVPEWEDYPVFTEGGWKFCPTDAVCESLETYFGFIRNSIGELGVAKEGYITTRGGWLSDRSMAYLGCGRPVVTHDTGWKALLGDQPGLQGFASVEQAAAAMEFVAARPEEACASARELARTVFSAKVVLPRLLEALGI